MSTPNLTAKKGRDCGHIDATSTLCFDTSHLWQGQRNNGDNVRYGSKVSHKTSPWLSQLLRGSLVARCTLLSARTRSTSSRLCWEIFRLSSSDTQPSQDRQALSSNWEPSCTLEGKKEECVRWRVSTETHLLINLLVDFHKESTSHKRQVFTKSVKIKATVVEISWLLVTGSFTSASFLNLPYLVNPHGLNCTPPVCNKRLSVAHL